MLGAVLMVAATVALMLALTWGGMRYPLGLGADRRRCSAASVVLWRAVRVAPATAREPFLPLAVLLDPVVDGGTPPRFFGIGHVHRRSTIYVPLYFETGARALGRANRASR